MKVAHIPPRQHLNLVRTGINLTLLHEINANPDYYIPYYTAAHDAGEYTILDNSAYELGESLSVDNLMARALEIKAKEVVVPDVMHNAPGTLYRASRALASMASMPIDYLGYTGSGIRLMLVPHGKTIFEWGMCLEGLIAHYSNYFTHPPTIGVPKDYEEFVGGRMNLIQRFVEPLVINHPDIQVHLLGVGEDLNELNALEMRFPWIRSTDTVKGFAYGYHKIELHEMYAPLPAYPGRPENYFELNFSPEQLDIALYNCEVISNRAASILDNKQRWGNFNV